jgi:hypothetical protein
MDHFSDVREAVRTINSNATASEKASAGEVLAAARELSSQAEMLNSEMSKFLDTIRRG